MDVDVDSVETELNAYTRDQLSLSMNQVTLDTGPLIMMEVAFARVPSLGPNVEVVPGCDR